MRRSPLPHQIPRRALEHHCDSRQRVQRQVLSLLDALPVLDRDAEPLRALGLGEPSLAAELGHASGYLADELVRVDAGHGARVAVLAPRLEPSYKMVWLSENLEHWS